MIVEALMALALQPQEARATLQSCTQEGDRWVCRYEMPTFEIVAVDPTAEAVSVAAPPVAGVGVPPPSALAAAEPAPPDEPGVLNVAEQQLVLRCADAGWMSLCLPADRRRARELKAEAETHQRLRLTVTELLGEKRCDEAVTAALDGGSLSLAREARAFCAPVGPAG